MELLLLPLFRAPVLLLSLRKSRAICFTTALTILIVSGMPLHAQFMTHLRPETNQAFDKYIQGVDQQLSERWQGKRAFLLLDEHPEDRQRAHSGELIIRSLGGQNGVSVPDGIVHDWIGAVFFPGAKVEQVVHVLQDFDQHKKYFPEVVDSRTVDRNGDVIHGFWRLRKTKVLTVVLDVDQTARYTEAKPDSGTVAPRQREYPKWRMPVLRASTNFPRAKAMDFSGG